MVKAIPTILFFIFLYFYFKVMLFGPLSRVLKQRREMTAGARESAQASLAKADRKQQEYEKKFTETRGEVYRSQEDTRRKWLDDQAAAVAAAKAEAEQRVLAAREQIAADAAEARQNLSATAESMAEEIASTLLSRRAGEAA